MREFFARLSQFYLPVRTLDRYVMKQFGFSYLICTSTILGLFVVLEGISRLSKFLNHNENILLVMFKYFAAIIPVYFSQYLGPVLTLIAAMFAVTLLNKGQELTPMKAAGISVHRIVAPCFLLAGALALLQVGVQEWILPNCKDFIRESSSYGKRKKTMRPDPVHETRLSRDRPQVPIGHLILDVTEYSPHLKRGHYALVTLSHLDTSFDAIIQAEDIEWVEEEQHWVLLNASINRWDREGNLITSGDGPADPSVERMVLDTRIRPIDLESSDQDIPFLSYSELLQQYRRRQNLNHLQVKLHQRFAFPIANLILLLLGLPFVLKGENQSVIAGVGLAMAISAAYLLSTTVCADLGNKGHLPPAVAAWLPVLFFGALGFTLFDSVES